MAGRPAGAARGGEGADQARRRAGPPAAGAPLGANRQGVPLRDGQGRGVAGGSLPGALAVARLPLHVRARLHGRLPGVLCDRGRLRRVGRPPRESRRDVDGRVARAARGNAGLQAADGLGLPVGVLSRQRLQLRLLFVGDRGAAAFRRRRVQLHHAGREADSRRHRGTAFAEQAASVRNGRGRPTCGKGLA